jgi:hypothetical protein
LTLSTRSLLRNWFIGFVVVHNLEKVFCGGTSLITTGTTIVAREEAATTFQYREHQRERSEKETQKMTDQTIDMGSQSSNKRIALEFLHY